MPSVREVLYAGSERVGARVYHRRGKTWDMTAIDGTDARLRLETIDLDIPVAAVYRGVLGL